VALFGRKKDKRGGGSAAADEVRPLLGKKAYCRLCRGDREFSKAWLRMRPVTTCTCCGLVFDDPGMVYAQHQPACPRCREFLEHPGFEYGLCDGCGSKFELVEGAVPSHMPNYQQRKEMAERAAAPPQPGQLRSNAPMSRIKAPGKRDE
jgi:hypothetical protein